MPSKRRPLAERLWAKVQKSDGCWLWLGCVTSSGYGHIGSGGRDGPLLLAHRVAYELARGPIPRGLTIDHLCRVRLCVNPDHLEAVTRRENILRGQQPMVVAHFTGICQRGHAMVTLKTGMKSCRECARPRERAWHKRNPERMAGYREAWLKKNPNYKRARKEKANARKARTR